MMTQEEFETTEEYKQSTIGRCKALAKAFNDFKIEVLKMLFWWKK